MTDTRTIAAGKALQHSVIGNQQGNQLVNVGRAPHSGLESERVVVRENLRYEVNTYTGDIVRKIAAYDNTEYDNRILRVAAYCRVSTDDIDQVIRQLEDHPDLEAEASQGVQSQIRDAPDHAPEQRRCPDQ